MISYMYSGNFPIQNNTVDMLSQVCNAARSCTSFLPPSSLPFLLTFLFFSSER